MDKEQAKNLIKETFENSFDKEKFVIFVKNFLNHIDESKFSYHGQYIPIAFREYINTLERIGKYSNSECEIDILIVRLKKETSLEHARSMQRNFIAWYLNGSRGGKQKDAALVAFVSPDKSDWRFSLVKMDYKFEHTKSGRIKAKEEFTPARRWSFLVGVNEKSHTAQSRLVDILGNDEQDPTLEEIQKAFNIETVTKEFFLKYRELFLCTKEELDKVVKNDPEIKNGFEDNDIDTVNFAKKLLGQIIFLYFLQKKGWFGVGRNDTWGTGSKHFLRELFEKKHGGYNNFFNDILEPLFYEALRRDRSSDDDYYSKFDCKIPFLNGGLFDPIGNYDWVHTDINLPNKLFSNKNKTKEGDTGDGILDIFDRYNFTVKEDEPLETEVAIDPELLGKSYEKFNAIRPDNFDEFKKALKNSKKGEENKFNKKFGVYYTPREIVHYMCQQSLINYLYIELLGEKSNLPIKKEDIKILIQYGEQTSENEAQVINNNRETRTYSYKLPESIRNNAKLIDEKLADIAVCDPAVGSGAFPVGMMSEIVKARNVLSIFLNDKERKTYNFKRHCIENSLYGVDIDPGAVEIAKLRLWLSLIVDEDNIKNIKPLPNLDYKIMWGNSLIEMISLKFLQNSSDNEREKLVGKLKKAKDELFDMTLPKAKKNKQDEINNLIRKLSEHDKNKLIKTLNQKILDIKAQQHLFADKKAEKERNKKIKNFETKIKDLKNIKVLEPTEHFEWHINFAEVFSEKAGFDIVIANPPYVQSHIMVIDSPAERQIICERYKTAKGNWDYYIPFWELAYNLLNHNGTATLITPNKWLAVKYGESLRGFLSKGIFSIADYSSLRVFENVGVFPVVCFTDKHTHSQIKIEKYYSVSQVDFSADVSNELIETLNNWSPLLSSKLKILIKLRNNAHLKDRFNVEEAFTVDAAYKLVKCVQEYQTGHEDCFKLITTGLIDKYISFWGRKSVKYLKHIYNKPVVARKTLKRMFQNCFNKSKSPKIILSGIRHFEAFLDDNGEYLAAISTVLIRADEITDLKILLGILNSRLINFYVHEYYSALSMDGGINFTAPLISKLPIPQSFDNTIHTYVNQILAITSKDTYDPKGDSEDNKRVKQLERQIDQMVYKLYNLTPEEIKIVEESVK